MGKGKPSEIWKEIKPRIGDMVTAANDMEQSFDKAVKEAYDKGYTDAAYNCHERCAFLVDAKNEAYQNGLNDLWEAMQKAIKMYCEIDNEVFLRVFHDVKCDWGESVLQALFKNTPQHLIDSIREYEQRQEEQIQVGDEIETPSGLKGYVVNFTDDELVHYVSSEGRFGTMGMSAVLKTGRHFPEIAAVLQKMKES